MTDKHSPRVTHSKWLEHAQMNSNRKTNYGETYIYISKLIQKKHASTYNGGVFVDVPHLEQNLLPGGTGRWQFVQVRLSAMLLLSQHIRGLGSTGGGWKENDRANIKFNSWTGWLRFGWDIQMTHIEHNYLIVNFLVVHARRHHGAPVACKHISYLSHQEVSSWCHKPFQYIRSQIL